MTCKMTVTHLKDTKAGVLRLQDLSDAPLAVMVWFHGGAYTGGGNVQYPGHFLAAKGVIVVVPNYRLDSFGKFARKRIGIVNLLSLFIIVIIRLDQSTNRLKCISISATKLEHVTSKSVISKLDRSKMAN